MVTKKQTIGFLAIVLTLVGAVITGIVITQDNLSISIKPNSATFKSKVSGVWVTTGIEKLYIDGVLVSGSLSQELLLNNVTKITRTNVTWHDSYTFDGTLKNVETFPVSHEIHVTGSKGKQFKYVVSSLKGVSSAHNVVSGENFGYAMKVTFDDGYTSAKVTKAGTMTVIYTIPSDDWILNVRLFDPPCVTPYENFFVNNDTTFCVGQYFLNDTDSNGSIIINASNIVLDCNNSLIQGNLTSGSIGINLNGKTNVTVKNCQIRLYSSRGISGLTTHDVKIYNNVIFDMPIGIRLSGTGNRYNVYNNTIYNTSTYCIQISQGSTNSSVYQNNLYNCTTPFQSDDTYNYVNFNYSYNNIIESGASTFYRLNASRVYNNNVNCRNTSKVGLDFRNGTSNNVYNNQVFNCSDGIKTWYDLTLTNITNNIISNVGVGINIKGGSTYVIASNNNVNAGFDGIGFYSYFITIYNNTVNNSGHNGIDTHLDTAGLISGNATISYNRVFNSVGDGLFMDNSENNTVSYNTFINSSIGIQVTDSNSSNRNIFYNNTVYDVTTCIYSVGENTFIGNNLTCNSLYVRYYEDNANGQLYLNNNVSGNARINASTTIMNLSVNDYADEPQLLYYSSSNQNINFSYSGYKNYLLVQTNLSIYNQSQKIPYNDVKRNGTLVDSNIDTKSYTLAVNENITVGFFNSTAHSNKNITVSGILCPLADTCIVTLDYDLAEVTP